MTTHSNLKVLAFAACISHAPSQSSSSPQSSPEPSNDSISNSWRRSPSTSSDMPSPILLAGPMQPLGHSTFPNSNHRSSGLPTPPPSSRKSTKRRTPDLDQIKHKHKKKALKQRRDALMEKAMRIKSLDNSPVNDHQLLVLRMVYDQITQYPTESWMVLLAIVLRRAFKQVKNWFSNERQKSKQGRLQKITTKDGDTVRLRQMAHLATSEWSDAFFEEVIMIYDFKVLMELRGSNDL